MNITIKELESDTFLLASRQFEDLVNLLRSPETKQMQHGSVESLIQRNGYELLRLLLQAHLDERAHEELHNKEMIGSDGEKRIHCRQNCERRLTTLFGDVIVRRLGYSGLGLTSIFPMDKALNLPKGDHFSHGIRKRVGQLVAQGSFDEACKSIEKYSGAKIAKLQIEILARKISQDFQAYQEKCRGNDEAKEGRILVMTADGKGIVVRHEDLRESTKKAAQKEKHKLKTRLSRGEKNNRKRMAMVTAIYEIDPYKRTAKQVLGLSEESEKSKRPRPINKKVFASIEEDSEIVIDQLFQQAIKQDPEKKCRWLMMVDGHKGQLNVIKRVIEKYQADVVIVQDFIHVLEYIWKAAYSFYSEGSQEAEAWVMKNALEVLQGNAKLVAGGIRRSATRRKLSTKERQSVDKCADYLLNNQERLDYSTALRNGWPIATGIIEGACRHLVKDRMDITGARWSLIGAEAILRLRALCINEDFDEYMTFHEEQEKIRNYGLAA